MYKRQLPYPPGQGYPIPRFASKVRPVGSVLHQSQILRPGWFLSLIHIFDRTERRNTGIEDTPDGFPFGSVVAGSACTTYIDIVYGSGYQSGRGYGLTDGKERPVSVGGTSCLVVGFIGIGVTAEFAIRSFSKGFLRLKKMCIRDSSSTSFCLPASFFGEDWQDTRINIEKSDIKRSVRFIIFSVL